MSLVLDILFQKGTNYILLMLVPIFFGANIFNELMYCLTLVSLASQLQHLGIEAIAVRQFQIDKRNIEKIRFIKSIASVVGVIIFSLIVIKSILVNNILNWHFAIFAIIVLLSGELSIIASHAQATNKYLSFVRLRLIASIFTATVKIFALAFLQSLVLFIIGYVFQHLLIIIVYSLKNPGFKIYKVSFAPEYQKTIISNNFAIFIGALSFVALHKIDILILNGFGWGDAVGGYAFASQTIDVLVLFFGAFINKMTGPLFRLSRKPDKQTAIYRKICFKILSIAFFVSCVGLLLMLVISYFDIGTTYNGIVYSTLLLLPSTPVIVYRLLQSKMIVIAEIQLLSGISNVAALLINLFLNYLFVPQFGVIAAAGTTFLSMLFSVIIVHVGLKRKQL